MKLVSFSYKYEVPEADKVFDCRVLPNPHREPGLKDFTGLHAKVQAYVARGSSYAHMMAEAYTFAKANPDATLAFGCVGGKHRSVTMVEILAQVFKVELGIDITKRHLVIQPPA